jgi:hypothetical protein
MKTGVFGLKQWRMPTGQALEQARLGHHPSERLEPGPFIHIIHGLNPILRVIF